MNLPSKRLSVLAAALAATGALSAVAIGDVLNADANTLQVAGKDATVLAGQGGNVQYYLDMNGNVPGDINGCNGTGNNPVTVTVTSDKPAVIASPGSVQLSGCGSSAAKQLAYTVAANATPGTVVTLTGTPSGGRGVTAGVAGSNVVQITVGAPVVTNTAPTVAQAANDATGTEGSELTASGSFADAQGDALTIEQVSGPGSISVSGNSWTWSYTPADDETGTVEVRATETGSGHLSVVDAFDLTATNVAPNLAALTVDGADNCHPTVSGSFTDPGADQWSGTLAWGDGSPADTFSTKAFGPVAHAYQSAGTKTITANVSDDDGGASVERTASHVVNNIPSAILQPINSTGNRSAFKLGSTIPVKLTVADCAGASVTGLAPMVSIAPVSTGTDPNAVLESSAVSATATNGQNMRYDATASQYVYNLSTKAIGAAGVYKVFVSDGSFARSVTALIELKK